MKLKDIMTPQVETLPPEASVLDAAQLMDSAEIGAVPVCDGPKILGLVTDRDITIKVIAKGLDPNQVQVRDILSSPIIYAFEDQTVAEAAEIMEVSQIRRLVVLNRQKSLVGVVALGDIARRASAELSGEALEQISEKERVA